MYPLIINDENKDQYTEIKNIKWLTEEECIQHIRDHDKTKIKLIKDLFHFLNTYESHIDVNL